MRIIFWGCRGSIPVPGRETLRYGGNTSCVEVRLNDGSLIILDAGTGIRNLGKKILQENEARDIWLLLTHPHWDHLAGFPFFAPIHSDAFKIHVGGGPIAKETVKQYLEHQLQTPFFPVRLKSMKAQFDFTHGIPMAKQIGRAEIIPIPLSHPVGFGYKIVERNTSFVYLPDNELDYRHEGGKTLNDYVNFCREADLLVHDGQYTTAEYMKTEGWGHSRYSSAVNLAVKAKVKQLAVFHHDPDHDDNEMDRIRGECEKIVSMQKGSVDCQIAMERGEISI
jgi:phosphoribosyl 1,2-cyclic phosphodiesterase